MHVLIHDFAGHPFQTELSRELARHGRRVTHGWFAGDSGPKGRLRRSAGDPEGLDFQPFGAGIAYSKTNFLKRLRGDRAYGREVAAWIEAHRPGLVISGNTPVDAQEAMLAACRRRRIPLVIWSQDFFSIAVAKVLARKLPGIGAWIGRRYLRMERRQMLAAAHVIQITPRFSQQTDLWGIPRDKITVIPNWGAISEIGVLGRETGWAQAQGLSPGTRFLYSGTLALKHNPALLARLAEACGAGEEVVVVSAGVGAEQLAAQAAQGRIPNLRLLPLQPVEAFPQVLASGDVLLAVIEREAGEFSVPSKVLSYLCAGRPIVLAAPRENLAATTLAEIGAGVVVEPEDIAGFVKAALAYRDAPESAAAAGAAGRRYAEANFDVARIAARFEAVIDKALGPNPPR